MPPTHSTDARLLLLDAQDNCLIAGTSLPPGSELLLDGVPVRLPQAVPVGHKLARRELREGDKVLRCGAVIGTCTQATRRGEHLHTHNLASDYLPTYTLDPEHQFKEGARR